MEKCGLGWVSATSRQVFLELCIGVAKPTPDEWQRDPHHMVDVVSIHDPYSAGRYGVDARQIIDTLFTTMDHVVLVGGSGLYINAIIEGMDELPGDLSVRQALREWYDRDGIGALQEELQRLDPAYYAVVDKSNPHRLMRALEVVRVTGKPYSQLRTGMKTELPFEVIKIGLTAQREVVYDRINRRVEARVEQGWEEEAGGLWPMKERSALQAGGDSEWFDAVEGKCTSVEAIAKHKQHKWKYAKKQCALLPTTTRC